MHYIYKTELRDPEAYENNNKIKWYNRNYDGIINKSTEKMKVLVYIKITEDTRADFGFCI